jgi:hypothetical protein
MSAITCTGRVFPAAAPAAVFRRRLSWAVFGALVCASLLPTGAAAPAKPNRAPWERWTVNDPASAIAVDHSPWDRLLDAYVVADHPSGVNRVRYGDVTSGDRRLLDGYVSSLEAVTVSRLNRSEQEAYWINLYNALTLKVVLDRYPVKSIRDIDLPGSGPGGGPWQAKLLTVEGERLSLDDIEHRILRPIWKDPRLHYALNCASVGCPDLQPSSYGAENLDDMLERAAREFVGSPRGVRFEARPAKGTLVLSSIYDWFIEDFGGTRESLFAHLLRYLPPEGKARLERFGGAVRYEYDWALNE